MEALQSEREILLSWKRCMEKGLLSTRSPVLALRGNALQSTLNKYKLLVGVFEDCTQKINGLVTGSFLLTDSEGILLKTAGSKQIQQLIKKYGIEAGTSFTEESSGTNAVALALKLKQPVYLLPEHHYCNFFQRWYCYAIPLCFGEKIIGYLDVSTVEQPMTKELIATTKLLGGYIIKELRDFSKENAQNKEYNIRLTDRHLLILKLLAEGLTEEEVGKEMYISRNTIKYHKKTIFSELGVKNSKEAVAKALGLNLISLQ